MREPWTFRAAADADECERRLTAATSQVGYRYYLNTSNAGNAASKFRGVKKPLHPVQIARWESTLGRDSFVAWLCADLIDDGRGGTEVRGWVGVDPRWSGFWPVWIIVSTLWSVLFVYSGLRAAISGQLVGVWITLAPLGWLAANVVLFTYGARHCRNEAERLRTVVQSVLTRPAGPTA